jgi:hypothetical protein
MPARRAELAEGAAALIRSALILLAASALVLCLSRAARADVQRFAVIVGNNTGDARDTPLRYAESDATRVYEVLRDLGGFKPVNMVLLKGETQSTVEDTLIAVNERARAALLHPGSQAVLFVYYSGHADADAFHLGTSRLSTRRVTSLVAGSAATFRLMVVDACRSGGVTRAKGGRIVPATPLFTEERIPESGLAFLAASAAHEDAQESEEIRGSFFTHALVSGLMGAADHDGDGAVSLHEAYQYAYGATLRATSRTLFGTQHPVFRFDFAGQGAFALTRPQAFAKSRAVLEFSHGIGFLVLRDGRDGPVIGEIGPQDRHRTLSVKPGRYFVRGRGPDVLYEGRFDAQSGTRKLIDTRSMDRVDYARLVRKGGRSSGFSHGPELGARVRSRLSNADTACIGGFLGYAIELEHFGARGRLAACTSEFSNQRIDARTNEYDLELRLSHTWDVSPLALDVGLGGGAALFTHRIETDGSAPPRDSLSPYLMIEAGAAVELGGGVALGASMAGETHFLRIDSGGSEQPIGEFAARFSGFARKWF